MNALMRFLVITFVILTLGQAFAGIDNYLIPKIRFLNFDKLTQKQQNLFTGYFKNRFPESSENKSAEFWNQSAEVINQGLTDNKLLSQSQLASFIGVTSMWEHSGTIDLVKSVEEIRDLSDRDGYRLIGTFHPGGGEFITQNWTEGGISKSEFKNGRREPIAGSIKGQFTMTGDLKRFNSDVDYHPPKFFWLHGKRENSDIRRTGGLHRHLESHIKKYGDIYADGEFPIQK